MADGFVAPVTLRRPLRHSLSPAGPTTALAADEMARRAGFRVALVNMPFVSAHRPSIQCGLLAAIARRHGFAAETVHLNVDFAALVGVGVHESIASYRGRAVGEWLFSIAAFGDDAPDPDAEFIDRFAATIADPEHPVDLRQVRDCAVPAYLDAVIDDVDWAAFDVVGFTSSFQQNNPSFALARRIKEAHPHVTTLIGGANFEGDMGREWMQHVTWLDYAVDGEADVAFPELLVELAHGRSGRGVAGVIARDGSGTVVSADGREPFDAMDELPTPIYEEYFERAERFGVLDADTEIRTVDLPVESARGCWWGAKAHCTFCGLNGKSMTYRSKSPERALAELAELAATHRAHQFQVVDNIIDTDYFDTLLPWIIETDSTYEFFYEVKADLTPEQVATMKAAGVTRIQPGIESLSTRVLGLMRKGVRASTNVNLLRWCAYHGVRVSWNLLWGFPGESADDYDRQADLIPHLLHLEPPTAGTAVWLERYSPLFTNRDAFPAAGPITPEPSLHYVYPDAVDLNLAAYFFEGALEDQLPDAAYDGVRKQTNIWREAWDVPAAQRPILRYRSSPGLVLIEDDRGSERRTISIDGPLAQLYLLCSEKARSPRLLRTEHDLPWTDAAIEQRLMELVDQGLMMRDGNLFLALAIPMRFER